MCQQAELRDFELWRWFFFFGGLAPIWWFGDFVVRLLVFLVESAFLNTKNVMYFLVAIRVRHPCLVTCLVTLLGHERPTSARMSVRDTLESTGWVAFAFLP